MADRPPRYIYQRRGGPLVTWNRLRPPAQTRAADATSLGSLGDSDVFDQARRLPRGGAPEYIADGLAGCGCGGKKGAEEAMGCCGMGDVAGGVDLTAGIVAAGSYYAIGKVVPTLGVLAKLCVAVVAGSYVASRKGA